MKLRSLLLLALAASGCRFWYKPVPVADAIGEERAVLGGDTLHVYRGERFEVYGENAESVYDGYEQLNRAYRGFDRYFGGPSRKLAFLLDRNGILPLDDATLKDFREREFTVVHYRRPSGMRTRRRYRELDYGGTLWPVAPTAARLLLAGLARPYAGPDAAAAGDAVLLERFPVWYRAAVMRLAGDAASPMKDLERVRERRNQLIPLATLLTFARSPSADSLIDPSFPESDDEFARTLAAQSGMLARYLIEREGERVIGQLGRGFAAGRRLSEMMAEFRSAPRTVPELERRWLVWIDTRE